MKNGEFSGVIEDVCLSASRGPKTSCAALTLVRGFGVTGDAHYGKGHRQLSLLEAERIDQAEARGLSVSPGAFGENIIVRGVDFSEVAVGRRFRIGEDAVVRLTQKGKYCPEPCGIYHRLGDCIMSGQGVFAAVERGGVVRPGDPVKSDPRLDVLRFAVVTLSDRATSGEYRDESGPLAAKMLEEGLRQKDVPSFCLGVTVLPDDRAALEAKLIGLVDTELCDVVVTTGGTGLSPRDVTPEATLAVIDRQVPGMAEAMRAAGLVKTPHAMLSRAVCGLRASALIINLSGSPKAVKEQLSIVLPAIPHAVGIASGAQQG